MYILGLSCYYHDSSAAILKDGQLIAAAEEERFTRKKHDNSFPINSINFCLKEAGIKMKDVNYIAFYEKPLLKFDRLLSQHLETFPMSYKTFIKSLPSWLNEKLRLQKILKKKCGYKGEILYVEHHLSHAASAFLVGPFEKAAILVVDGVGEWATTSYGIGEKNQIKLLKQLNFPSSIGLLYSTITGYLGFSVNNSEYKVMGLSPYGLMDRKKNNYYKKLKKVIDLKEDGSYALNMKYFKYHFSDRMPSNKLSELLDSPVRSPETQLEKKHMDIAAALQMILEDVMTKILKHVYNETGCENIVLAGGVALNSVYNGKILKKTPFKKIWIQPNATDGGASIGAAYYVYNCILKNQRNYYMKDAYLGPKFTDFEIRDFLDSNKIKYKIFHNEKELIESTAKLIYENNVVGWFQGRMEFGPRALGSRSILSNACNPNMQEILNLKVKHREKFRPFAPVVCEDDAVQYFECDVPISEAADFMLMVYPIKEKWHSRIPSVTHVDGSGRLQTIKKFQNPKYYNLIKEFGKLSGIPILINTSFNIRGEPIVCSPYDAYKCMMGTGIDFLVIDKFLIKREDNSQDVWDSEKYAKD